MDVQAQVQALIDEAPDDLSTQEGIQVVADVLGQVASSLGHPQYYVLQNFQQQWQVTTLQHRNQTELQKTVLYAYGHLADATRMGQSAELIAAPIQIVPLLFQFFSFTEVDSLLFVDEANQPDKLRELKRQDLQTLVQSYLEQHVMEQDGFLSNDLTDIA
jgi:hypothetical protein